MNFTRSFRIATAVLATFLLVAPASAQDASKKGAYKPEVGQPGKDVVWVPTPQALVDRMLDAAKVTPADYLIDLGSGDGRTVITAAKRGVRALGIEYNPDMVELAKRNARAAGMAERAQFVKADLFESDFSKATVITMFLLNDINLRLRPKILELTPGTRIVSNTFRMGDWDPDEEITATKGCDNYCNAYYWVVPAKVAGNWKLGDGVLSLKQIYQKFIGVLTVGGKEMTLGNPQLNGAQISFSVGAVRYRGRVSGNTMDGSTEGGGKPGTWKAVRTGG
jgi:Methyltransferase domain